jgi:hypothetical protein
MLKRDGADVHPIWAIAGATFVIAFCILQFRVYFGGQGDWGPRNAKEKWLYEKAQQVQGDAARLSPADLKTANEYTGNQSTRALSSIYRVIQKHK